jgi:dihydropyrimidinase
VLRPGADADIVLYDPAVSGTITADDLHTIAGYTPYEGMRVKGHVVTTIRRGEILVHEGEFLSEEGSGKFMPR